MQLNFEKFNFQLKSDNNGQKLIFDPIRQKYVVLTPEEWVRQHIIQQLVKNGFPMGRISVERMLPQTKKRYDIVFYGSNGQPILLVECKAPSIHLNQKTLKQITSYIQHLDSPFILLSNGIQHISIQRDGANFKIVHNFPHFSEEKNVFLPQI
ncbi:MAG: type I restriction enzyme HsdR N-terminal domain-containing protein [Bacteroidota bacterium]